MLIRVFLLLLLLSCNVSYASLFGDNEAREQINALRKQVGEMEARIAKMEQALNSQALLELYAQVETLGLELGKLNGQIEMLSNDNALLQKRQRDFYIDLDNRLRQIEQPGKQSSSVPAEPASFSDSTSVKEQAAAPPAGGVVPETSSSDGTAASSASGTPAVSYTHLTLPTNREV